MRKLVAVAVVSLMALSLGCSMTGKATEFNGLKDFQGKTVTHLNTTNIAIHLLFSKPLIGDATLQKTVSDFTLQAKDGGAQQVRIVQSSKRSLWWLLPPITFIVQPVITNVAGDAIPPQ